MSSTKVATARTETGFSTINAKTATADAAKARDLDFGPLVSDLRKTFFSGKTKSLKWRKQQLNQMLKMFKENHEIIEEAVAKDLGGPSIRSLFENEYKSVELMLDNFDEWTKDMQVGHSEMFGKSYIRKEPKGVVLLISPWNYPLSLTFKPLCAMIAAGNCVVIKPSEVSANCCVVIEKLVKSYLDPEAIRVVTGGVAESTALLRERFDHIMYTGNGHVGRIVMTAAAKHLTPCTLELGGKSPVYVDKSAKLDAAVARIGFGKHLNAGQTCIAPDYLLVHADVYDEFKKRLIKTMEKDYGNFSEDEKNRYTMINNRHVARVRKLLNQSSGKIVAGGVSNDNYISSTVLENPGLNDEIMEEEIFGPVLPIHKVASVEEAVEKINKVCVDPLALYVFAQSQKAIDYVLNNTTSGGVSVNTVIEHITNQNLPFGGVGNSGMGRYNGLWGVNEFSHFRAVFVKDTLVSSAAVIPPKHKVTEGLYKIAMKLHFGLVPRHLRKPLKYAFILVIIAGVLKAAL